MIVLHELMNRYIPPKLIKGNKVHKQWIDKKVKALYRKRNKLFKKQRKSKKARDISHHRQAKASAKKAERQAYWRYVDNLIEVGDPDEECQPGKQKRFWSFIRSVRKDSSGMSPLKDQGRMFSDPTDQANILNRQYESTFTREDISSIPILEG